MSDLKTIDRKDLMTLVNIAAEQYRTETALTIRAQEAQDEQEWERHEDTARAWLKIMDAASEIIAQRTSSTSRA